MTIVEVKEQVFVPYIESCCRALYADLNAGQFDCRDFARFTYLTLRLSRAIYICIYDVCE